MAAEQQGPDLSQYVNDELLRRPENPLAGQAALVTGATRLNGIGFGIAERFALEGTSPIILVGTERSQDVASYAQARLQRYGVDVYTLVGDVTSEESATTMMQRAYEVANGNINILVNNAGTNRNKSVLETTAEDYDFVMDPKARGAVYMTREWAKIRNQANIRGGRIITIGSVIGIWGNRGQVPYEMANGALNAFTVGLATELGPRGITVNLIAPMFVEGTDMTAEMTPEEMNMIRAATPLGELIETQDIAGVAAFLAGPDGRKISGQIIPVDCGLGSGYKALRGLHQAGYRMVPPAARRILDGFTRDEATLIEDYRNEQAVRKDADSEGDQ